MIDTPGLFDTNKDDAIIAAELSRVASFAPHGISAVLLVVPRGRFTAEHEQAIRGIVAMFGESVMKHIAVVVTGATEETSEKALMTRDILVEEIEGLPVHHYFRRYIHVNT